MRNDVTACLFGICALLVWPGYAAAQPSLDDLRRDLAALEREVRALRAELDAARAPAGSQATPLPEPPAAATLDMLRTQVGELAQVKVESVSRLPVRLFGTVHTHVFANSANANWLESPNLVNGPPADGGRTGSFSASLRQTRLGLSADGPALGSWRASGNLALDFFGGIPGFQTGQAMGMPRLLVAFVRLADARTALQVGQDHVLLAPRDPTSLASLAFPALFRAGNLYLRAPQVRLERTLARGVSVAGGIVAPIGGDLTADDGGFVPPALGGERSRRPGLQARLQLGADDPDATRMGVVGISGHVGWERRTRRLDQSWAAALDFAVRRDRVGLAGEVFAGDNIDAFGGALGLDRKAAGGWVELRYFASPRWSVNAGYGHDELIAPLAPVPRRRNHSAYGNLIVAITPEIDASLEYKWLSTIGGLGAARGNHHADWVLTYKF